MTISISNAILHQIDTNDVDELIVNYRSDPLPDNAATEALVSELHRAYSAKAGKGFGLFLSDSEFKIGLQQLRNNQIGFLQFTSTNAERLKDELCKYPFADTGVLVFAEYRSLATEYLFVAIIPSIQGLQVDTQLDVGATDHLDVAAMTIAARIDLTTFETDPDSNRYISFLKGRVGRKVADFFFDFLQIESGLDVKAQNQVLVQAIEDFIADDQLDKEESLSLRKQVKDYCKDQLSAGEEIVITELSGEIPASESGVTFQQYTEQQGYELEPTFPTDKPTIEKLDKFKGCGGGLTISFDAIILGERIFYEPETDTLTIKGTPPNLRDQLIRRV
ncbi:nucleoid-associated protein YejK [Vibrio sp. HA2012]|uniref:nucleoid-associated protein YejK n=1 Tax=Vibrio sp. HA2012 TaxID=1971595 RepID=UPI000C2BCC29|nr:nucleoid-associated protein YejK [Vibrio sp. HA2012]PJC87801.1 nucleoid-associated protein YejK [Vibrio sp. HA2012]